MKETKNKDVQTFLNDTRIIHADKADWLMEIRQIILKHFPQTEERMMYGGIVFFLKDEMYSGLFLTQKHITLEFSKGFLMKDPNEILEGKGEYRRHLKIMTKEDIANKKVSFYVKQAV